MQFILIVGFSITAAVAYGLVHDQITARICVEYFTIGHPRIIDSTSPMILGIAWGVIATWWVGLILGLPLGLAARVGSWPQLTVQSLVRPIFRLLEVMVAGACLAGLLGWQLASRGIVLLSGYRAVAVPASKHVAFQTVWFAHLASYSFGLLGGIVVIILSGVRRYRMSRMPIGATTARRSAELRG